MAATIATVSGCHARTRYLCGFGDCAYDEAWRTRISEIGDEYAEGIINDDLQNAWKTLANCDAAVDAAVPATNQWWYVLGKRPAWWEAIDVARRECHFFVFRHGASLAVLICEDLARIDPVQNVVRAVGPNLVIAVLMDGPQLERRWPVRYATVVADDPGSAILTLTSLGLIRRSQMPSERGSRQVALWKEPLGAAQELELPADAHALLLTISQGVGTSESQPRPILGSSGRTPAALHPRKTDPDPLTARRLPSAFPYLSPRPAVLP